LRALFFFALQFGNVDQMSLQFDNVDKMSLQLFFFSEQ